MGTTTVPPRDWELNPDSKIPRKVQSVPLISATSAILSFLAIKLYWLWWSYLPQPRTPYEATTLYFAGPALLFWVSFCLSFMWFGMNAAGESEFKNPLPLLRSYAWAVLGIPAGSVLFNEALTTPRGFITKTCYLIAGSALLTETVVLVHLIQARKPAAGNFATGRS